MREFSYFSKREVPRQEKFRRFRDGAAASLADFVLRKGATANGISITGLACIIPFAAITMTLPRPGGPAVMANAFIWLHVLLDGFDGIVARRSGRSGPAGWLVDALCDHGGLVGVVLVLSTAGLLHGALAVAYVYFYTLLIVFMVALNWIGDPFHWVFRTKYWLYGLHFFWALGGPSWFNPWVGFFTACNIVGFAFAFGRVHRHLGEAS